MKYEVFICALVYVRVHAIEANSAKEALTKAEQQTNVCEAIGKIPGTTYTAETAAYMVNEPTDSGRLRVYNAKKKPSTARRVLRTIRVL